MAQKVFVGVDIGGTKVAAGLVDAGGAILSQCRVPMVSNSSAEDGLNAVLAAISKVIAGSSNVVQGIGICAPGPLDPRTGVVLNPPNVPCWRNCSRRVDVHFSHESSNCPPPLSTFTFKYRFPAASAGRGSQKNV